MREVRHHYETFLLGLLLYRNESIVFNGYYTLIRAFAQDWQN